MVSGPRAGFTALQRCCRRELPGAVPPPPVAPPVAEVGGRVLLKRSGDPFLPVLPFLGQDCSGL